MTLVESRSKILQLSRFPSSFKTPDLIGIFEDVCDKDAFRIKWIDDTTALAIFRDPEIAKTAYLKVLGDAFVKVYFLDF